MNIPNHLGVIIDGNRRHAREKGLPSWEGHKEGAEKLEQFLNWSMEIGIKQISVYMLSTENLKRPKKELKELFNIFYEYLERMENGEFSLLSKYQVKVRFIGDLEKLPPKLVKLMGKVMQKTTKYQKRILNLLIAYGSQFELTNAVKKLAEKIIRLGRVEITPKDIEKNLMVTSPLDLIIRTGGQQRLSNFLLWQASYAELFTTETLWPAFTKREFMKAIKWYGSIQKNYGA